MRLSFADPRLLILIVTLHSDAVGQQVAPAQVAVGDGVTLHYVERGEGEPIIFIHGLTGDYSVWMRQLEAFAREGYRAISYSRRYNYPNRNRLRPNHSAAVEADDLAAFIRKLELENVHVVGHSYGAYTALILAMKHPDLLQTLVLAEPPIAPWLSDLADDPAGSGRAQSRKLFTEGVKPARAAFASGDNESAMRAMMDAIGGPGTFDRLPKFVQDRCRRNVKEMKAIVTSQNAYPLVDRDQVRRLAVPTLLLSGSNSVATARYTDPELERLLPEQSCKRIVLEGATHIMWVEQPVPCREAVLEFIRDE